MEPTEWFILFFAFSCLCTLSRASVVCCCCCIHQDSELWLAAGSRSVRMVKLSGKKRLPALREREAL